MIHRGILVSIALPFLTAFTVSSQDPPFEDEIRKFEAADKVKPPVEGGVVFVGSSSIRMWTGLQKDFPAYNVINRGFGGSVISDSVRNAERIVTPYKPKAIVFFAGTNDIASGKSPETVRDDYRAFVEKVRAKVPHVPIAFISLTPAPSRWAKLEEVKKTNTLIREYCKATPGLRFIDVFPLMLTAEGGPRPELFLADQLHMKRVGYEIWTKEITPVLKEMLP